MPPVKPMLAKPVKQIPDGMSYEPKFDGFRSIVFRDGDEVYLGSRNEKPMTRYFPELVEAIIVTVPDRAVIDGEIVVVEDDRLEFERLSQRIHPAQSRVLKLAAEMPASFVAFDLLALGGEDLTGRPFQERRDRLADAIPSAPWVHVAPATQDVELARTWFASFEGAGIDGLMAKPLDLTYQPDKRVMFKIKPERTADCVVAGFRWYRGSADAVGSLMLGLYDAPPDQGGTLHHVGVIGAFPMATRRQLAEELAPLVVGIDEHVWSQDRARNRWNADKDLSFTPLSPDLVVEVKYDHMEGARFRHTAQFSRWRPDRDAASCTFDQLEQPDAYPFSQVLAQ